MMVVVAIAGVVLAFAKYLFIDNRPRDILEAISKPSAATVRIKNRDIPVI